MRKGENAGNYLYLHFQQFFLPFKKQISKFQSFYCLQMLPIQKSPKFFCLVKGYINLLSVQVQVDSLAHRNLLDMPKFKVHVYSSDNGINMPVMLELSLK